MKRFVAHATAPGAEVFDPKADRYTTIDMTHSRFTAFGHVRKDQEKPGADIYAETPEELRTLENLQTFIDVLNGASKSLSGIPEAERAYMVKNFIRQDPETKKYSIKKSIDRNSWAKLCVSFETRK